jgi:benzil reductase ((S)-benzoin forming)
MQNIFISGISSGIGQALAQHYAQKGHQVYGVSRRSLSTLNSNIHHLKMDLLQHPTIGKGLDELLNKIDLDLVILNAGVLGRMTSMQEATMNELKNTMEINLWSQKVLLDCLLQNHKVKNVIGISSGAAINGNLGWSGYSLSKAAFNMLIQLYAKEFPLTHFIALAPGLVDTPMQDYLCGEVDAVKFPSVSRLQAARGTENMPTPSDFAIRFEKELPKILQFDSGSYVDLRNL